MKRILHPEAPRGFHLPKNSRFPRDFVPYRAYLRLNRLRPLGYDGHEAQFPERRLEPPPRCRRLKPEVPQERRLEPPQRCLRLKPEVPQERRLEPPQRRLRLKPEVLGGIRLTSIQMKGLGQWRDGNVFFTVPTVKM